MARGGVPLSGACRNIVAKLYQSVARALKIGLTDKKVRGARSLPGRPTRALAIKCMAGCSPAERNFRSGSRMTTRSSSG